MGGGTKAPAFMGSDNPFCDVVPAIQAQLSTAGVVGAAWDFAAILELLMAIMSMVMEECDKTPEQVYEDLSDGLNRLQKIVFHRRVMRALRWDVTAWHAMGGRALNEAVLEAARSLSCEQFVTLGRYVEC